MKWATVTNFTCSIPLVLSSVRPAPRLVRRGKGNGQKYRASQGEGLVESECLVGRVSEDMQMEVPWEARLFQS